MVYINFVQLAKLVEESRFIQKKHLFTSISTSLTVHFPCYQSLH